MAMNSTDAERLDNASPALQQVSAGTEIKENQDNITNIKAGKGITLPTSDPGVAGELWADTLVVKVSAGA